MSPEERAHRLLEDCDRAGHFNAPCGSCTVDAIRAAVAEEREACARLVNGWRQQGVLGYWGRDELSAAIRARKP
jgi:hypothetical protein